MKNCCSCGLGIADGAVHRSDGTSFCHDGCPGPPHISTGFGGIAIMPGAPLTPIQGVRYKGIDGKDVEIPLPCRDKNPFHPKARRTPLED